MSKGELCKECYWFSPYGDVKCIGLSVSNRCSFQPVDDDLHDILVDFCEIPRNMLTWTYSHKRKYYIWKWNIDDD